MEIIDGSAEQVTFGIKIKNIYFLNYLKTREAIESKTYFAVLRLSCT
jgi:hypothetical protein